MQRTIILLDLPWTRDKDPRVPLGHARILSALRRDTPLDVRSLVIPLNGPNSSPDSIVSRILAEATTASGEIDLGIGVYIWCERVVCALLRELRRCGFSGRIILGGPQISYTSPNVAALYPGADAFIRGYAESALCELAMQPGRPRIPGVVYRGGFDQALQAESSLSNLPSPWLDGTVPVRPGGLVRWETQRGCPYKCSFCQHRQAGTSPPSLRGDRERLDAEIDLFAEVGVGEVAILDPVFNSRTPGEPHRATRILEQFAERGFEGRISLQCRPELIDDAFLDKCRVLDVQLEFGLQTVVPQEWGPIRRGNKLPRVDAALRKCIELGIDHQVSLIFGLPLQTLASFEASVQWCLSRDVQVLRAFPLMLLRGTTLERERDRWDLRETDTQMPVVCASSSFDQSDWLAMARISDSLRATEGEHPYTVEELRGRAGQDPADMARWTPG